MGESKSHTCPEAGAAISLCRLRLSLARGGRTRDLGAAALESFQLLNLSKTCASAAHPTACLAKEAQATNVLAIRKAGLCVSAPFLAKMSA